MVGTNIIHDHITHQFNKRRETKLIVGVNILQIVIIVTNILQIKIKKNTKPLVEFDH